LNAESRALSLHFVFTTYLINTAIGKLAYFAASEEKLPFVFYRGCNGKMRHSFQLAYNNKDASSEKYFRHSIGDLAVFSTTSSLSVATGKVFGGDILMSIRLPFDKKSNKILAEAKGPDGNKYRMVPAPISWLSQYPSEDEYLWPTGTLFTCESPKHRNDKLDSDFPKKRVYQFTPQYLWNVSENSKTQFILVLSSY
jgi:hypothetical protein